MEYYWNLSSQTAASSNITGCFREIFTPWVVGPLMCQKNLHISSHFSSPPSLSQTLFTQHLPSLMSPCRTQGPPASVQFLFWHPLLITHVNDWSPGLWQRAAEMGALVTWRLCDYVQVQDGFCWRGTVETDTHDGLKAGRLSSEHPLFGPKTLPISSPRGASCTGAAGYLWLFVWSNPTQLKPRLTARTFKLTLWHLRGLAAESRTRLLLWNVIWLIDFGVAGLECLGRKTVQGWTVMEDQGASSAPNEPAAGAGYKNTDILAEMAEKTNTDRKSETM